MGPKRKSLDPHFDAIFVQVGFQVGNGEQFLVEDARRKARVDAFMMEQLEEVFLFARPGPCAPPFPGRFCLMIRLFYFI